MAQPNTLDKKAVASVDSDNRPAFVINFVNASTIAYNVPIWFSSPPNPSPNKITTTESNMPTMPPRFNNSSINSFPT